MDKGLKNATISAADVQVYAGNDGTMVFAPANGALVMRDEYTHKDLGSGPINLRDSQMV